MKSLKKYIQEAKNELHENLKVGDKVSVPVWDPNKGDYDDYDNAGLAKILKIKGKKAEIVYIDDESYERTTIELEKLRKFK